MRSFTIPIGFHSKACTRLCPFPQVVPGSLVVLPIVVLSLVVAISHNVASILKSSSFQSLKRFAH